MLRAIHDYLVLKRRQKTYSKAQIDKLQLKLLRGVFQHAKQHSPYYQRQFGNMDIRSLEDLRNLPTTNKTIMMDNFSDLNTCQIKLGDAMAYALQKELNKDYLGYYQKQYVIGLSSGTSGNKGLFITPKSLTKRLPAVFLARGGVSLKDLPLRILFCLRVFSQGFSDINAPLIKLKYVSTMTPPKEIVDLISSHRTNLLMAPPSLLRVLLPYAEQLKGKLKKIITYAEVLTTEDKSRFETAFAAKVVEIYQASEGQIASPCELGNLHINEDLVHVDLYDENNNIIDTPHVIGHKMILTNLINKAQPLIRYEMNDMIVLDEPCPCGSNFRTIKSILGRKDDLVYFPDQDNGVRCVFPDLFARWIVTTSDSIREFQVIQEEIGRLQIKIDAPQDFDVAPLQRRLTAELEAYKLSAKIEIIIEAIELPKDKNKFKRFIANVKPN